MWVVVTAKMADYVNMVGCMKVNIDRVSIFFAHSSAQYFCICLIYFPTADNYNYIALSIFLFHPSLFDP
jgi:hypothetical protein